MKHQKGLNKFRIIAKTFSGLEEILAKETEAINCENIEIIKRAVSFNGDLGTIYKCNYNLRTALKILVHIKEFEAGNADELYKGVNEIDWFDYFGIHKTFAIESVVYSKYFNHSGFVALKVKDAIADKFREKYNKRPSVDLKNPDIKISVHINHNKCSLLLDSSGEPLFKRGYRIKHGKANLNEVLAAGLILISGWDGNSELVDFMCGSGTIPIEAALIATSTPPQYLRNIFAFQNWANYDENLWKQVRNESDNLMNRKKKINIYASDISAEAINDAELNINKSGYKNIVNLTRSDFRDIKYIQKNRTVIINPPYGERLNENDTNLLYKQIGDFLKNSMPDSTVWVLSNNSDSLKNFGLRTTKKYTVYNGQLECKYNRYDIYEGSKNNRVDN